MVSSGLGHTVIESGAGGRLLVTHPDEASAGATCRVAVRPEKVQIDTAAARASDENSFAGRVAEVGYLGGVSIYKVRLDNGLDMKATARQSHAADRAADRRGRPGVAELCAGGRRGAAAMTATSAAASQETPRRDWGRRLAIAHPGALARRVLPRAVPDRAEDQPVADGDRAAALCAGARSRRRLAGRCATSPPGCRSTATGCSAPTGSI